MGNTGDGLNASLGRILATQGTQRPVAVVYVHDVETGRQLIGQRAPGCHGYHYREDVQDGKSADLAEK